MWGYRKVASANRPQDGHRRGCSLLWLLAHLPLGGWRSGRGQSAALIPINALLISAQRPTVRSSAPGLPTTPCLRSCVTRPYGPMTAGRSALSWNGVYREESAWTEPAHGRSHPVADGSGRRWLFAVVWARTRRDTCSPISNGIGSDKFLTSNPLLVDSSSHLERIVLPQRSNLFESHWSNQWLTTFS